MTQRVIAFAWDHTELQEPGLKSKPCALSIRLCSAPSKHTGGGLINSSGGAEASSRQKRVSPPDSPLIFLFFCVLLPRVLVLKAGLGCLSEDADVDETWPSSLQLRPCLCLSTWVFLLQEGIISLSLPYSPSPPSHFPRGWGDLEPH